MTEGVSGHDTKPAIVQSGDAQDKKATKKATNTVRPTKFEGRCDDLKTHVYDFGEHRSADLFIVTTKEIANHVGRTYKCGGDLAEAIINLETPTKTEPTDPVNPDNKVEMKKWEREYDEYRKWNVTMTESIKTLFNLVWGQCSETMQQKLESLDDYTDIRTASDGIGLLLAIKNTAYNYNEEKYIFESVIEAQYRVMVLRQNNMTPQQYYEKFSNLVSVYIHCGGTSDPDPGLYEHVAADQGWKTVTEKRKAEVKEMYWATLFILHADPVRYGGLITDLQNDYLTEIDKYPKTMTAALSRLTNWKSQFANVRTNNSTSNGVSFTNVGDGTDGETNKVTVNKAPRAPRSKAHITCFTCNEKGHYSSECPKAKTVAAAGAVGTANTQSGVELVMNAAASGEFDDSEMHASFQFICDGTTLTTASTYIQIPPTWILLDNQSTIDVFCNKQLLVNIHKTNSTMSIHCNAGVKTTTEVGELPGYGEVWYHPTGIANILSLSRVRGKGFHVTYENEKNCFILTSPTGRRNVFEQSPSGLYFIDTAATQKLGSVFVTTVEDNKSKFSQRDYLRAIEARKLLCKIGRPSQKTFLHILDKNLLPNCPVTRRDALNAQLIFGPDIGSLKGKTVRQSTIPIQPVLNDLPLEIMSQYRDVTLTGDIFFVNKIMFLVTRSRHIQFSTVETIPNRKPETVLKALINVRNIYRGRGFNITHLLFDGEYECLRGDMASLHITLNTASNDEHVPDIERFIRTLKERSRAIYNTLPFKKMPDRLVIEMICACNFWLNSFPPVSGISSILSPRAIITGSSIDYNRHCQLEFGAYVQTHEDHDNTMSTRTVGAIALRPTGNDQGGYYFYSLASGRVLNRNHWTELPMPSDVIDRIHIMARRNPRGVKFSDRHLMPYVLDPDFPDDDDDSTFAPGNESDDDDDDDDGNVGNVDAGIVDNDDDDEDNIDEMVETIEDATPTEDDDEMEEMIDDEADGTPKNKEKEEEKEEEMEDDDMEFDDKYGARLSTHGLRPRKPRDYGHLHTTLEHIVMTQYSVKKGLKVFGAAGVDAVLQELQQLHDRKVIRPVQASSLSYEEKKASLAYLMFLKEKRTGQIKGRGCADGRPQRETTPKEEARSPTVAVESVLLSCTMDAHEERDVAIVDIPGAFMQVDMEGIVHLRIDGPMADLLIRIDPEYYNQFVEMKGDKKVLYLLMEKALYGTLIAAKLFWKHLSSVLISKGFTINPYDTCVANKTIKGKQCTILWHVDDLKISHVDPTVVTDVIAMLSAEFGKEAPLTVSRGAVHEYLGMTLDFTEKGVAKIDMSKYVENVITEMPEDMAGVCPTPAANHLFEVNQEAEKLDETKKEFFHHVVAQLLFLCKRARPDIQTAIAFLCTRVQYPDVDDYKKLGRVIKYLRKTKDMPLRLEAESLKIAKWWVDASYAVHPDMKSHTGGVLSLGKGGIYGTSTRQRINAKSSTEAELIAVAEVLPRALFFWRTMVLHPAVNGHAILIFGIIL
jgi:Reverse transcriptase (RNA-dependent DNA polymerase)/Zinc knuckle